MIKRCLNACLALVVLKLTSVTAFGQNVTLTDNGTTVTLANGIVSATFDKSNGNCTDLRRGAGANLLANGGKLYFDANGSVNGGTSDYVPFTPDAYRVVTNTPQRVEIALTDTNLTGFSAELHYTMRAGDSGIYAHTVWRHGPGNPQATLEQSRMTLRCDPSLFTRAYSWSGKVGQMIEPLLLKTNPQIMDATYQLPLGTSYTNETGLSENGFPVYTKYDWSAYMENHTVHGVAGDNVGLWMALGSVEYFNGGPTKANQKVHGTDTTPVVLWVFHGQHFGSASILMAANEPWEKIMGPYFLYVNAGSNSAQLWQDAQQQAAVEKAAWPYNWVNDTNYPIVRGTVSGQLHLPGQSASNALLVLAQPGDYWQLQSKGYQFWTRAAADGSFTIAKVRPGTYTLFARVPGAVGEFIRHNVQVTAGQSNSLGQLEFIPLRRERLLWRIGTPDLSAGEFRFGNEMRQFGLWWRYMQENGTNDFVYRIGSHTAADWYYAQSVVAMDNGGYFSPTYRIQFVLTNLPPNPAVLTIDLAGGVGGATLLTKVNGTSLSNISITNDASIYRSATQSGLFRHFELSFSPSLLQLGTNEVAFTISKSSTFWTNTSSTKPVYPGRGVMWDCVQLEAGTLLTTVAPRFTSIEPVGNQLVFTGTGGLPGGTYRLATATNPATPSTNWITELAGSFDGNGAFAFTNAISAGLKQQYYRLQLP